MSATEMTFRKHFFKKNISSSHFRGKNISCSRSKRSAFTLLEVMISVMIISVVILALFEMRGNSSLAFLQVDNNSKANQYLSFFIQQKNFGFENKQTNMKNLTTEFDIDLDLRREFLDTKLDIKYIKLETIDMKDYDEGSEMIFEIGSTNIKINNTSASIMRVRLQ